MGLAHYEWFFMRSDYMKVLAQFLSFRDILALGSTCPVLRNRYCLSAVPSEDDADDDAEIWLLRQQRVSNRVLWHNQTLFLVDKFFRQYMQGETWISGKRHL